MLPLSGLRGVGALLTFFPIHSWGKGTALVAVNEHVDVTGHAATLGLAETGVCGGYWSRRNGG
jgi:hypothetical protein